MSQNELRAVLDLLAKATPGPWTDTNGCDVFTQLGALAADGRRTAHNDGWHIADCNPGGSFLEGEDGMHELSCAEVAANARAIAVAVNYLRTHGESIARRLEGWRPVRGFEDRYEVSASGAIRKLDGTLLSQRRNSDGYLLARFTSSDRVRSVVRVHRVVAEAFVPNPAGLPVVNHIDNKPANNCASNLEWCTQADNLAHMTTQGRRARPWAGKRSPAAKLSDETVNAIRDAYAHGGTSHQELALRFGVSKRTVGRIVTGKSYAPPSTKDDET